MTNQNDVVALAGRIFIAVLFLTSGIGKIVAPAATQGYIAAMGLPAPSAAYLGSMSVELIGSLLLIVGFHSRIVALVLAVFALLTAVFFHRNLADQNQMFHFLKNVAILGGLLQVAAFGAGKFSLDRLLGRSADLPAAALSRQNNVASAK
jgi:putative oxidoreductase